jgi:glycosyltransferase involved in cell wall biosynthesis
MIENPESLKGIGRRAQDLVLKNYSWDTIAGHYARIYQHLVQLPLQIPSGNTQIIAKGSDKV